MTQSDSSTPGQSTSEVAPRQPAPPAALPDKQNPAIIDARKTFAITVISAALFIGSVLMFIL